MGVLTPWPFPILETAPFIKSISVFLLFKISKHIDDLLVCFESTILLNISKHSSSVTSTPSAFATSLVSKIIFFPSSLETS